MRFRILLSIILVCSWMAASPRAEDQVVTIYFAGTNCDESMWRSADSSFDRPETVATLHHYQQTDASHHKGFVTGFDGFESLFPDWVDHNDRAHDILDTVPACEGNCVTLNLVGFSRGAVSAIVFARWVLGGVEGGPWERWQNIKKINVLVFDPVPGDSLGINAYMFNFPPGIEYLGFYAVDERSTGFSPVFPALPESNPSNSRINFFKVRGAHETLVGSRYENGHYYLWPFHGIDDGLAHVSGTLKRVAMEMLGSSDWGHVRFDPSQSWYGGDTDLPDLRQRFVGLLESIYAEPESTYLHMREYSHVPGLASWHDWLWYGYECRAANDYYAREYPRCVYDRPDGYPWDSPLGEGNASLDQVGEALNLNATSQDQEYVIWELIAEHGSLDVDEDLVDYADDNCPQTHNPDQADSDGDGKGDACDIRADAGPDQTVECTSPAGALATLDGSACEGDIETYDWFEGPLALGSGRTLDASFSLGTHTITLRVTGTQSVTDEDDTDVTVVDTTPPRGSVTFPPNGQCFGPAVLPVIVADDFTDICDPAVYRTYDPAPGPGYSDHGDYVVTVTAADFSGNTSTAEGVFTIDTILPTVQMLQPLDGRYFSQSTLPMSIVFRASDDDAASGGVLHEVIKLQGCGIYDGLTYGDMDGLLSDEVIELTQAELCRLAVICGFTELNAPELRVEASDCGANVGTASRTFLGGLRLFPGICGRALPTPTKPPRLQEGTNRAVKGTATTRFGR